MSKGIMVILDGMQDGTYPELGGKTPRQAGGGEAFARLEGESATLRFETTPPGMEADTLNCTLTLLGAAPEQIPAGRSCLEALAEDVAVGKEDMVLRCNFVKITPDGRLEVPCCTPPEEVARALMAAVARRHGASLKRIGGYKCLQSMPGARPHLAGLKTFPPHNYAGREFRQVLPAGNSLAAEMAATSLALLEEYRPYTVLNWAPSVYEEVPAFRALWGTQGALVTKTLVLEGLARAMGMRCPPLAGATGDTDTNLAVKGEAALALLEETEFVLVHVGGTDEATHRQDPVEKAEFIARCDRELLRPLLDGCPPGTRVLLTSDHAALCSTAGHTAEAVEAHLWEKGRALRGDLGTRNGRQAVALVLDRD